MRNFLPLLLLLNLSCGGCSSSGIGVSELASLVPEAGAEATAGKCGDLASLAAKWAASMRMEDWRITIGCVEIPDSERAWALSFADSNTRQMVIAVDPDAPDIDLTVLHEILHARITEIRDAASALIDEQAVRDFSERMICREKIGGEQ